ncbi:MAG TPA: hypothetical protein PKH10_00515, partial [bacterium]|nr:hypothetical protein [bacterium]
MKRMMSALLLLAAVPVLCAAEAPVPINDPVPTSPVAARKLLVDKIEAVEVEEAFARSLEEALVLDIGKREGFSVVTSAEMSATAMS